MIDQIDKHILQHWQMWLVFQFSPQIGDFLSLSVAKTAVSRKVVRSSLSWIVNKFACLPFQSRVVLVSPPSSQIKVSSLIENFSPSLQAPVLYLCVTSHSLRLAAKDLVAAEGPRTVQGHQFTTDLGCVILKDLVQ